MSPPLSLLSGVFGVLVSGSWVRRVLVACGVAVGVVRVWAAGGVGEGVSRAGLGVWVYVGVMDGSLAGMWVCVCLFSGSGGWLAS